MKWMSIPTLPGYQASEDGQIRSVARSVSIRNGNAKPHKRIIASKIISQHYAIRNGEAHYVTVRIGGRTLLAHRLIAYAFLGMPPFPKAEVNHKNGNRQDNRISNLEWVSKSENERHSHKMRRERAQSQNVDKAQQD